MKIHNLLPTFVQAMAKWERPPSANALLEDYLFPHRDQLDLILGVHEAKEIAHDLARMSDWNEYRASILKMDPVAEESRLLRHKSDVERLFGFTLGGEVTLFGAFRYMDGYARFDRGSHRVFLGIDESFSDGSYIDILTTHELTHVARESRPQVWEGFGLNPLMSQAEFTQFQPVIEHLMGEGLSCLVSEILVPDQNPWLYAYQDQHSLQKIFKNSKKVDEAVRRELSSPDGDYGNLYSSRQYGVGMPGFTHYVWAWKWVTAVAQDFANGNFKSLVERCSKDFIEHALKFELHGA